MEVRIEGNEKILYPEGRISADTVNEFEKEILNILEEHHEPVLIFDMERLEYISSAGLRLFLKFAKQYNENMSIRNVSSDIYEIFSVTGFTSIMKVEKRLREISVEGCELLGHGACGAIYRIDDETIVKVYNDTMPKEKIEEGSGLARYALLRGVPTAIAFDRVRVNGCDGAVFELLDAKSFQEIVRTNPDRLEEMTRIYVDFLRQLHEITAEKPGDLDDARRFMQRPLNLLQGYLPDDMIEKIQRLLQEMPEDLHLVHGDLHMKNLLYVKGEPMVIDMDTLCQGNPVFEFASIYNAFVGFYDFDHDGTLAFQGLDYDTTISVWKKMLPLYFGTSDPDALKAVENKAAILGYARLMRRLIRRNGFDTEEGKKLIAHYKNQIETRLDSVDTLMF